MKLLVKLLSVVILLQITVPAQTSPEFLGQIINSANIDSLNQFLKELTGEVEVNIDGENKRILTRYAFFDGNVLAASYLTQKLRNYGYKVSRQSYTSYGKNILAKKSGSLYPEKVYILCAHYDSMPESMIAPGADDNGSGTSAVLEAARVLKDFTSDYSILFAFWDEEELGLKGSYNYAREAYLAGEQIMGVINLDMIGGNLYNSASVMTTTEYSIELAEKMAKINSDYEIGIKLYSDIQENPDGSDDMAFHNFGYKAMLLIEPYPRSNPRYHHFMDTFSYIDHEYHLKNTILGLATLADFAGVYNFTSVADDEIVTDFKLEQNYPNPFNPSTNISFSIPEEAFVTLKIYDMLGREVAGLVNGSKPAGNYSLEFNASGLVSGTYFYVLRTGNYSETKKMLLLK